jgi:hypothetical protein
MLPAVKDVRPPRIDAVRYALLVKQLEDEWMAGHKSDHGFKADAGRRLGITPEHVGMILSGDRSAGAELVARAKRNFGLDHAFFYDESLVEPKYTDFIDESAARVPSREAEPEATGERKQAVLNCLKNSELRIPREHIEKLEELVDKISAKGGVEQMTQMLAWAYLGWRRGQEGRPPAGPTPPDGDPDETGAAGARGASKGHRPLGPKKGGR